jgi:6-pyruvoyltetrahydropterin/6-carboxytetrahydropterin synthase
MYKISKEFAFSSSHVLSHLAPDHPCARLHGHNYVVRVDIESPCLDDRGFCQVDYRELDGFKRFIDDTLDHRHLNDVLPVRTTAENIAKYLFTKAREFSPFVVAVGVSETPKTWATFTGP